MSVFQAIFFGAVQALTEFLPISSSGHLVVIPKLFGWNAQPLVFDVILHLGTAAALLVYFWKDLWWTFSALVKDVFAQKTKIAKFSDFGRLGLFIVVGSVPAGVLGFLLGDFIEATFRQISAVAVFLLLGTVLMFAAEKWAKMSAQVLNVKKSFLIGIFQSLALFPGISRSGSTISGGMFFGLNREEAARFSFLLSVPIVVLAGVYEVVKSFSQLSLVTYELPLLFGFLTSFLLGLIVVDFLLKFLKKNTLYPFMIYRLMLVVLLFILR